MRDVKLMMTKTFWIFLFWILSNTYHFYVLFLIILFLRKVFSSTDDDSDPLDSPIQDKGR